MTSPFLHKEHDHSTCIQTALIAADDVCKAHNARLTPIRRRVLELIWQGHSPTGAYELLETLKAEGHNSAPPTVYRALEFLIHHGLVHRIASLNAFVGCNRPGEHHDGTFLICRSCGTAAEIPDKPLWEPILRVAEAGNFKLNHLSVEAVGECTDCQFAHGAKTQGAKT